MGEGGGGLSGLIYVSASLVSALPVLVVVCILHLIITNKNRKNTYFLSGSNGYLVEAS